MKVESMAYLFDFLRHSRQIKDTSLWKSIRIAKSIFHHIRTVNTSPISEHVKINEISDDQSSGNVRVRWSDDAVGNFPHIFLRDNCQCPACFHPTSKQRLLETVKLIDVDIRTKHVKHEISGDTVHVKWPDNHESTYHGSWLRERKFPETWSDAHSSTLYDLRAQCWLSSEILDNLPCIDHERLMSSDEILLKHHENLFTYGLSIIKGAPRKSGVLAELAKRVSHRYVKNTHYGDIFTIKTKPSPSNIAYTSKYLPLHVDLPCYSYQPEILHLHCIEQSAGEDSGISHLTDGFRAAAELQKNNPDFFEILTKVKFKFNDVGTDIFGDFNLQLERPIIGLDLFGNVESISYNNHQRSSSINVPPGVVHDCYKAYYALTGCINKDMLQYKMIEGDILCFNNKRVLHGRSSFDSTKTSRWLEGCYMDFDEICSIYRVTREKMAQIK